jgi:hypothetical protein
MLASFPASMVNQKPADLGIPNRFNLTTSRFKSCGGIREATVAKKPGHRGEREVSRNPSRRESRSVSAEPVCSCAFFCAFLHTRPRVQRAPGFPCALYFERSRPLHHTSGTSCRENAEAHPL